MPGTQMVREERIRRLEAALKAAQAVVDEIDRRNEDDPNSSRQQQREPVRQRAVQDVRLLQRMIGNLEAAGVGGSLDLDVSQVMELDSLAAKLDSAIRQQALAELALDSVRKVLDSVERVQDVIRVS
jgi:chaperonin cofactor prefoldin